MRILLTSIIFFWSATCLWAQIMDNENKLIGTWKIISHAYINTDSKTKEKVVVPLKKYNIAEEFTFNRNGTYTYQSPPCKFPNDSINKIKRYEKKMSGIYAIKKGVEMDTLIFQNLKFISAMPNHQLPDTFKFRIPFKYHTSTTLIFSQAVYAEYLGTSEYIKIK
jgi:hypothetical protein